MTIRQTIVIGQSLQSKIKRKVKHGLDCKCSDCVKKTQLSAELYTLNVSLFKVPKELRPFVLMWREKFSTHRTPRVGQASALPGEISPWQENAIRALEDFEE